MSTAAYYGHLETEEAASYLTTLGVPCCEAFLQTMSEYPLAFGKILKRNLGGVEVVSAHSKTLHFEGDFLAQSPRQRGDGFAMLETFLTTAEYLGARVYVFHGPPRLRGVTPPLDRWQPFIEEAMARCEKHGIRLAWETVSWCWLNSMERIDEFAARWPRLQFVLDVKQVMEMKLDPVEVARRMGDRLCHIHMLDYDENGRHALPGRGRSDFKALSRYLRESGYKGDVILEPYSFQTENRQEVLDSLRWLRETFQTT